MIQPFRILSMPMFLTMEGAHLFTLTPLALPYLTSAAGSILAPAERGRCFLQGRHHRSHNYVGRLGSKTIVLVLFSITWGDVGCLGRTQAILIRKSRVTLTQSTIDTANESEYALPLPGSCADWLLAQLTRLGSGHPACHCYHNWTAHFAHSFSPVSFRNLLLLRKLMNRVYWLWNLLANSY